MTDLLKKVLKLMRLPGSDSQVEAFLDEHKDSDILQTCIIVATDLLNKRDLELSIKKHEEFIANEKKGWRDRASGDTSVEKARALAEIDAAKERIDTLNKDIKTFMRFIDRWDQWTKEEKELDDWATNGFTGQRPSFYDRQEAEIVAEGGFETLPKKLSLW
jgi:hypothetical protein